MKSASDDRRVLFVHNSPAKFTTIDFALIRRRYTVREWYQKSRLVDLGGLARAVAASDMVFGWFASWHTFFPILFARALGVPSVLVTGGYDTANLPEINYGSQRGGLARLVAQVTQRNATGLITHSNFTRREVVQNARVDRRRVTVVYLGLDASDYPRGGSKERSAITVGGVSWSNLARKGLEPFVRAAAHWENVPFYLVGAWLDDSIDYLKRVASPNVKFVGQVDEPTLHSLLAGAQVYVQASRHEGFGLAVAEAMLCECIPVVTNCGALPEVVGESGIYIESSYPAAIGEGIGSAFKNYPGLGVEARRRIETNFTLELRQQGLERVLNTALATRE